MLRPGILLSGVSTLAIAITAAQADPPPAGTAIEEIVVTAEKVSKNLQDTPIAVTAIGAETLDQDHISSAKDLNNTAPGLVLNSTPSNPLQVTIRGAGYEGIQNNSAQPGVSFNENGVYISSPVALNANFLDVDQIEVLRGPQGTVLGQNSDGGAIDITTVRPQLGIATGTADFTYGSYNDDRVRFGVNIPVGDTIAVRAAFQQQAHDGYTTANGVPGQPNYQLGNEDSYNGRLDALWKPIDKLTIEVWGEIYENSANGDAFKNILDPNPNPYQVTQDFASKLDSQSDIAATKLSYDFGFAALNVLGSYQHGKLSAPEVLDKLDFADAIQIYGVHDIAPIDLREGDSYTQEIDLTSVPGTSFDWIVGAFGIQQSYDETFLEYQYKNPNAVLPASVASPGAVFATGALAFESIDTQRLKSESLYAQGTYHITDTLRFTGGIRGTLDNQQGLVAVFFNPAVDLKASFQALTGKAELEYDVTPDSMVYGMWSSGIKPGGTNLNPSAMVIPTVFQPEQNNAIEIGSKNELFDKHLRLNAAAFYNFYHDYQVDSEDPIPFEGGLTNIGDVRTYGIEAEATALLPYNLRVDGNLAAMSGEILSHQQLLDPETAQLINKVDGGVFTGNDLADRATAFYSASSDIYGKTPPKVPAFTANLTLSHTLEFPDGLSDPLI